jgi:hypothetical protein
LIEGVEVARGKRRNGAGDRFEVIDEAHRLQAQLFGQASLVEHPWQVGDFGPAVEHRPSDREAGAVDPKVGRGEKPAHECGETLAIAARIGSVRQRGARARLLTENAQRRLSAAYISCQKHCDIPPLQTRLQRPHPFAW